MLQVLSREALHQRSAQNLSFQLMLTSAQRATALRQSSEACAAVLGRKCSTALGTSCGALLERVMQCSAWASPPPTSAQHSDSVTVSQTSTARFHNINFLFS
eukprot:TRINITY_DN12783_c0_g1_i1.p2 TRINITY_DN12783_c0_g1~~TRINITY_DN12783_c0_g1_i1.p2  ORF type:complete len:102 (-),score=15.40 TRINITY_DN12783_c0_g1_i1:12-317(-)